MQTPERLDADWSAVSDALSPAGDFRSDQLVSAMMLVSTACANAIRNTPIEPLTADEQRILDDEREDDPRFYDLMFRSDSITSTSYVLEWFDKSIASAQDYIAANEPDQQKLADSAIMCWDHIVPEYHNHQLAHMAALVGSQLISPFTDFHNRTWLFRLSDTERWSLFLGLAQQLDTMESTQVKRLAIALSAQVASD